MNSKFKKWLDSNNPLPDHMTKGFKGSQWKQGAIAAYKWCRENPIVPGDIVHEYDLKIIGYIEELEKQKQRYKRQLEQQARNFNYQLAKIKGELE